MRLADAMLAEFERSLPATRKHLERVPEDKLSWRPAPTSMTLGQLALHVAMSPGGVARLGAQDSLEIPDFGEFPQASSVAEVLKALDASADDVRRIVSGIDDERMEAPLEFRRNGQTVMSSPRAEFLRDIMLNHTYHHRGQLSVYLRELGVPVPATFGPTADEEM